MYHERTYEELAHRRRTRIVISVLCLLLCAIIVSLAILFTGISRKQATVSIRDSITNAALQCAAVEGSYPSSLAHLERYYGLTINHDDYLVTYEWLADNIPPSVTVVPR